MIIMEPFAAALMFGTISALVLQSEECKPQSIVDIFTTMAVKAVAGNAAVMRL